MTELLDDLSTQPEESVWALVAMRYQGLEKLKRMFGEAAVGYRKSGGYECFSPTEQDTYEECISQRSVFNERMQVITGLPHTFTSADDQISSLGLGNTKHLLLNVAEGEVDTGKLMRTLLTEARRASIDVWGGLEVSAFEEDAAGVVVQTSLGWSFRTGSILLATNAFSRQLEPDLAVVPARNQVIITTPITNLRLKGCFHYHKGYVYFRQLGNQVLLGGARHLDLAGETTDSFDAHPEIRTFLHQFMKETILPYADGWTIERAWSGIIGRGDTKVPIVKTIGNRSVAAVRLGGMGVAIGSVVGAQAADLLADCW
jgi:glycine/D-amino acid oxidase-like deaminating enzyme